MYVSVNVTLMKCLICFLVLIITGGCLQQAAAQFPYPSDTIQTYILDSGQVKTPAAFPGGMQEWKKFLTTHMRTDSLLKARAPKGVYTLFVSYVINKKGYVTDIEVLQDPGYGLAEEIRRVLRMSPRWLPAESDGNPVPCQEKQKITYQVN
jgi:protein TonB